MAEGQAGWERQCSLALPTYLKTSFFLTYLYQRYYYYSLHLISFFSCWLQLESRKFDIRRVEVNVPISESHQELITPLCL